MKIVTVFTEVLSVVFWVLVIFGFDLPYVAVLTIAAALIHELAHLTAIFAFKKDFREPPKGDVSGFRISVSDLSYKEEMVCALAGPLSNLLFGGALLLLSHSEYCEAFAAVNIMTALSNLLPMRGYDGYKFLLAMASAYSKKPWRAEEVLNSLSFALAAVTCFISLYLILKIGEGYWIFAVFFSFLLSEILKRQKSTFLEKNGDFRRF